MKLKNRIQSFFSYFKKEKKEEKKKENVIFFDLTSSINNRKKNQKKDRKKIDHNPITKIKIKESALEKIFAISKATDLECYCLLLGYDDIVEDIFVPLQEANGVHVTVDGKNIMEIKEILKTTKYKVLGWAHSHCTFSVFFSSTDMQNQNTLLIQTQNYTKDYTKKWVYGMTVNHKREMIGYVSTQYADNFSIEMKKADICIIKDIKNEDEKIKIKKIYQTMIHQKLNMLKY